MRFVDLVRDDEECAEAINAVIYCSGLKGFTREKRFERVFRVFEEMMDLNVELSIVSSCSSRWPSSCSS